jgi:hypothetical protein
LFPNAVSDAFLCIFKVDKIEFFRAQDVADLRFNRIDVFERETGDGDVHVRMKMKIIPRDGAEEIHFAGP